MPLLCYQLRHYSSKNKYCQERVPATDGCSTIRLLSTFLVCFTNVSTWLARGNHVVNTSKKNRRPDWAMNLSLLRLLRFPFHIPSSPCSACGSSATPDKSLADFTLLGGYFIFAQPCSGLIRRPTGCAAAIRSGRHPCSDPPRRSTGTLPRADSDACLLSQHC